MNRNKRISKPRKINPTYFVFCEGKTERSYIEYLRAKYRLPIHIDFQIAKSITEKHISSYKKNKANHLKDKIYLVYDLDVPF